MRVDALPRSKMAAMFKLCCSTGDGGRRSQRYHTQNGTILFSIRLHPSHIYVLCITILTLPPPALSGTVYNTRD